VVAGNTTTTTALIGGVLAVSREAEHGFTKHAADSIEIAAGPGVRGDAHSGKTVQHLSRMAADPDRANLRQVHPIHAELLEELKHRGFELHPRDLGENITTRGIDLIGLGRDASLGIGPDAVLS
jgi:MOSC domain-containing protein YiiM